VTVRTLYALSSRAETYLLLPLLLLVLVQGSAVAETVTPGYWTAAVAKASVLLFIILPLCAVCAAWEGVRHRRGRIEDLAAARPAWQVVLVAVAPTLAMGLAGVGTALAVVSPVAAGARGWPDPRLIVVYSLVVVGHTVTGYALGRWLPPAVALPASLGGSYIWLAYPAAIEPFWIRHLNGLSFEGCCAIDRAPATRAVLAAGLFACGLGCGALIALHSTWWTRVVGTATFATLAVTATAVAFPLGPSSSAPRTGHQRCAGTGPVLCLWPEQESNRETIQASLTRAYQRLDEVGIRPPSVVTTRESTQPDRLFVVFPVRARPKEVIASLVSSLVPDPVLDCAADGEWPGANTRPALVVWLALSAGIPGQELRGGVPIELVDLGERVRQLSVEQQLTWYRANLAPLRDCVTQPRLDPAEYRTPEGTR
jgi:hypothetical protein